MSRRKHKARQFDLGWKDEPFRLVSEQQEREQTQEQKEQRDEVAQFWFGEMRKAVETAA